MEEIWKAIPGYEGIYEVSDQGNVRRLAGRRIGGAWIKAHPMKLTKMKIGYLMVGLWNVVQTKRTVHSLVAEVFLGPLQDGHTVNHLNGVKTDNRLENLEYCTRGDNIRHSYALGLSTNFGENNYLAKLTEDKVRTIRAKLEESGGRGIRRLGREFGVSHSVIAKIRDRKSWKHVA